MARASQYARDMQLFRNRAATPARLSLPLFTFATFAAFAALTLAIPLARAALPSGAPVIGAPQPIDAVDYIPAPSATSAISVPQVAFDGTNYAVVWTGSPALYDPTQGNTVTARVSPAGAVLDPQGVLLPAVQAPNQEVATGGVRSLFYGVNGWPAVRTEVDSSGHVLGTTSLPFSYTFDASASNGHVVVGAYDITSNEDGAYVYDASGNLVTSDVTLLPANGSGVVVAAAPNQFLLVSGQSIGLFGYDLTPIATLPLPANAEPLFAAAGASDYIFLYAGGMATAPTLYAERITQTGTVEDAAPIPINTSPCTTSGSVPVPAAAAWNGTTWQLAWVTGEAMSTIQEPYQLMTGTLSSTGTFTAGATLETAGPTGNGNWNLAFDLAAGPAGQTFITWMGGTTTEMLGARFDATGATLDPTPITISTVGREELDPLVVRGDSGYLAVWTAAGRGVLARRFDSKGAPLDATPIVVTSTIPENAGIAATYFLSFQAVASGHEYFVSWRMPGTSTTPFQGARIGDDGTLLDTTPLSLPGLVIAGGGGDFLAVDNLPDSGNELAILDSSGAVLVAPFSFETSYVPNLPAAAWNGASFDFVWPETANAAYMVKTALIGLDGKTTALPPLTGNEAGYGTFVQAVAMDGGNVLVAFDWSLQVVSSSGSLVGSPASFAGVGQWPSLSSDAPGRALAVWQVPPVSPASEMEVPPVATSVQAVSFDFTSSPPLVGQPFSLGPATLGFGVAVASDGVSGDSLVVGSSTPNVLPMPSVDFQTLDIPLASPGNDGGADGGGGGQEAGSDGGMDAGNDAGSGGSDGGDGDGDAAAGDASHGDAGATGGGSSGGCGCTTAPAHTEWSGGAGLGLLAFTLLARRSRKRGRSSAA